jgi:flagellar biosynthesis/type III secretory pathway M-ring protein FliF/YscJ
MRISDTQRKHEAMLHEAEERDLERIIETIEGVDEATVKIMERRRSAFGLRPPEPVGVAVSVRPAYGRELDQMLANTIISMAHNTVWRSQPDRIVVTDASTGREFRQRTELTFLAQGGERFRLSEEVERRIAAKIEKLLRGTGYPPNVVVSVKLDLQKTVSLIEKTYDPKEKGAVDVYRLEETTESEGRSVEGVVGAARGMGLPVAEEGAGGAVKPETSTIRKKEFRAVADVLFKHVVDAPGEIAEVRVSGVLTPRIIEKHDENGRVIRVYENVETAAKQKELEEWKAAIANISGAAPEAVTLLWRSAAYLSPEERVARPEAEILAYVERYGPMAVVSLLAMLALFFLYGLGRRAAAPAPVPLPRPEEREREEAATEAGVPEELRLREMQNRIRAMAGQDPRKVASLVKRWIVREG